jgi:hypothetical protein
MPPYKKAASKAQQRWSYAVDEGTVKAPGMSKEDLEAMEQTHTKNKPERVKKPSKRGGWE